jgi:hypothetical protein
MCAHEHLFRRNQAIYEANSKVCAYLCGCESKLNQQSWNGKSPKKPAATGEESESDDNGSSTLEGDTKRRRSKNTVAPKSEDNPAVSTGLRFDRCTEI